MHIPNWEQFVYPVLAPAIAAVIRAAPAELRRAATEIRLRVNLPLLMITAGGDVALSADGKPGNCGDGCYVCSREDLNQTMQLISRNSIYAFETELRLGYLTIAGGHRVGLAGQAILAEAGLKALKNITSLNIRLAREVRGAADTVAPYIIGGNRRVYSTLFISPPRCGKTTVLRDLVRQLSSGVAHLGFPGVQVGLVDERSEIAACRDGSPSVDLGPRVDVLDGCPKATGMLMLIRAMAPQVVVTDELGREEDALAVQEALHAGVSVIASVHGRNEADIAGRPYIGELVRQKFFERYVILGNLPMVGTVEDIIAVREGETLYSRRKGVRVCG
jgi:stage III sporulation protein AA